jgi:hypothetical protein
MADWSPLLNDARGAKTNVVPIAPGIDRYATFG